MKKHRLKSRRVRVVLPASRIDLPSGVTSPISEVIKLGRWEAENYMGSKVLRTETFDKHLGTFPEIPILARAFFFAGMYSELEQRLREKPIPGQIALENMFMAGAVISRELCLTQLHLTREANAALFLLPDRLSGIPKDWWNRMCAGALTLARLAHFLVEEGLRVYFPLPIEDIHWKIDLIASSPGGEAVSLCFQVKSNQEVVWLRYRVHRTGPNGRDSELTHRFWEGVRCFQKQHRGIFVPVELTFGSRQFMDGAVIPKGYIVDALRHMLADARSEDPALQDVA